MRVGIIGTGAVSHKHAQAYRNIGYELIACTDINPEYGKRFAAADSTGIVRIWDLKTGGVR